jgi:parallel beta-helix repeat protein
VIGNVIGANVDQTTQLGNVESGILVQESGSNTLESNAITASGRAGIMVLGASLQNRVTKNAIYDNRTLGIDLNGDGVTQNDPSDLDSGPNNLRNFPIITSVSEETSGMMISGFLPAPMAATQTIELFRAMPNPSGYGEGGQFLGEIKPDAEGNFSIMMPKPSGDAPLATAVGNGDQLTATAIDIAGNTSEFSPNFIIGIGDALSPSVQLFSPNGGELVNAGETMTIRWQSFDNIGVVAQDVLLSTDNGRTFTALQTNLAGAIQQLQVSVPVVLETAQAVVCVVARDGNRNEVRDCSDSPFVIFGRDVMPPSVRLASPNGGEIIASGQPYTINWQSGDDRPGLTCTVYLSTDGGANYTTLTAGLTGVSSYTWQIPATLGTTQARIRVTCRDAGGLMSQDESDANFAIDQRKPEIRVGEPNGGMIVLRLANNPLRIQWTSADDVAVASHDILLSLDNGETFSVKVAENVPGSAQSYDWIVPRHIRSGKAVLRIVSKDFVGRVNQDDSDRTFILFRP